MRPLTDFEKSSISFALGVSLVAGGVAWKTGGEAAAVGLTVGIPLLFYSVWGYYEKKHERIQRMRDGLDANLQLMRLQREQSSIKLRQALEVKFGENANDNPLAYVSPPIRGERRVLLPKDHERTKQRLLQGREVVLEEDEVNRRDQWHD